MNEKKKEFIKALCNTLKMDGRSGVESIEYATDVWFEDVLYKEFIEVRFKGGAFKLINVTANSNGANAQQIIKAVYGGEPVGLLFCGFEEKKMRIKQSKPDMFEATYESAPIKED